MELDPLAQQVRDFRYEQRLSLASFLSGQPESEERTAIAVGLIRELAMHQLYERFSKQQLAVIQDKLTTLAYPLEESPQAKPFGNGAVSKATGSQATLF